MNKVGKVITYAVGATVIAGASAYLAMPKDTRDMINTKLTDMFKKKNTSDFDKYMN